MSRVAAGHFRRKREAPLIVRGSTSQCRGHPRNLASPRLCAFSGPAVVDLVAPPDQGSPSLSGPAERRRS